MPWIEAWHDWQFSDVNWLNFSVIHCEYERNFMYGQEELHLALLGLHVRISRIFDPQTHEKFSIEMKERMKEMGLED